MPAVPLSMRLLSGVPALVLFSGGAIASKIKSIKEWQLPIPSSQSQDAISCKGGAAAAMGAMLTDYVSRLDTKSGEAVDYFLPRNTNIRRVFVEEAGVRRAPWVGSNHDGSIEKVEPLD